MIGHEFGHFANRDHLSSLGRGLVFNLLATALLGTDNPSSTVSEIIESFLQLNRSRDQEYAADEWGLRIVQSNEVEVENAFQFFDRLPGAKGGKKKTGWKRVFSTHPFSEDRAKRLQARISKKSGR